MALDADLVVDELSDNFVVTLGEQFAPLNAFSVNALEKATYVGRNTVQVEKSSTAPAGTGNDNRTDYEAESGANTNIAVTVNEISFNQEITSQEQIQGHKFMTAVPELSKALGTAVWDKITAIVLSGTYGAGVTGTTSGSVAVSDIQSLRVNIDSPNVSLLIEHSESAAVLPDDKNSFQMGEMGAYGYNHIYAVSNFAGGTANTYAFACAPTAAVVVAGAPRRHPVAVQAYRDSGIYETFTIPGLDLTAEYRIWANTKTGSVWMSLAACFGITAGDGGAGSLATHA